MTRISDKEQIGIIAKNISRLLFDREMTQSDLAKVLGVSEQAVTNWVKGNNAPNMGNIQRMADYFRVSMMEILDGPQKPSSYRRAWLMDRTASASDEELELLAKLWEEVDKETEGNW